MKLKHLALYGGMILVSGGCATDRIVAPNAAPAPAPASAPAPAPMMSGRHTEPYTQPMFVIDGEVVANIASRDLDPNEILDIQVVKGAAALAAYGQSGATGIVIITTKHPPLRAAHETTGRMLVLVDGAVSSASALRRIPANRIAEMRVLRGRDLVQFYGPSAAEGVVLVRTTGSARGGSGAEPASR
jgi:TonB-dependent SusC/RagA subfamily outer membrane receptor